MHTKARAVLEQVQQEPEATYELYTSRWEDMGGPAYKHPSQPAPGHIVGLTWDSALYKFGIDRWAGVWNDYGNPDRFRFSLDFGERAAGRPSPRVSGSQDGLPVITTTLERDGLRYEVEQFAYPLNGPPDERRGDIPMVLLQKVTVANLRDQGGPVSVKVHHRRKSPPGDSGKLVWKTEGDTVLFEEDVSHRVVFVIEGPGLTVTSCATTDDKAEGQEKEPWKASEVVVTFDLAPHASRELVVKFPSPPVASQDSTTLMKLEYATCRDATLRFWEDWLRRGAQFTVPEKAVNDLYRANLWHALRLPRRHGGQGDDVQIDLPYSNFAYDQHGTPWPVNQAVYVDYMIYALRGYHDVAAEEMLAMYRNNQEPNGHVKGYANWGVYTPSMIYVTARNYLLSDDRETFERLLPHALRALDWCLSERAAGGLVRSPLNDLTGDGVWAFTQAYVYAALDMMGRALERAGHPRAQECMGAAKDFRRSVEVAFSEATMLSPLVQLRDHTWTPYVPCEVESRGRRLEQWYPTDVDTGAMHLLRLKALPSQGMLAEALLNDHEDNLYLHGWGMANEPVYNPQATAYLLRDDPKAVIRAFYSMMACAFSHSVLEPVEHRWTWGQYFGPPSTDGAWFELYRNMLVHELDDGSLLLMQATPRKWLADGQRIAVERAPTYYGEMSLLAESHAASGTLTARIEMPGRYTPKRLIVRIRHPEAKPIQSATVNGQDWSGFDREKEWVVVEKPTERAVRDRGSILIEEKSHATETRVHDRPCIDGVPRAGRRGGGPDDGLAGRPVGAHAHRAHGAWPGGIVAGTHVGGSHRRDSRSAACRHSPVHSGVLRPAAGSGTIPLRHAGSIGGHDPCHRGRADHVHMLQARVLFPVVDQDIVEPNDYSQWDELIFRMVRHYKQRDPRIRCWEIANEPDIGESGGCPYRFQPENYTRYYRHTVEAILRADPNALVGGPALAGARSPILPRLLEFCEKENVPLHFVSWHIYSSDPQQVRGTIDYVNGLLSKHPGIKAQTMLNEWNVDLSHPPEDPRFQPCFVAEVVWQMKEGGARLLLLLSHPRLPRCDGAVREVHVAAGDHVHVPLVESAGHSMTGCSTTRT